ncbi:hypothetical protein NC651_032476 [Populus alba x Populus x berolinensis]|nr:hypothetical protein NC651_032476 [Populus alba x Populus x berolinensis]
MMIPSKIAASLAPPRPRSLCFPRALTITDSVVFRVKSNSARNKLASSIRCVNILENELLRQGLKEYSSWPTFPQLYIDGEFLVAVISLLRHIRVANCRYKWKRQCALETLQLWWLFMSLAQL